MKKAWLAWLISAAVIALLTHFLFMLAYPSMIMTAAMKRLSHDGARENVWIHASRVTEASRAIVRPSPDLAYSSCVYDLSGGPVGITIAPWGDYMSLSLFGANTDNYYTINDRRMPSDGAVVIVRLPGQMLTPQQTASAFAVVESPSERGVALIRRLAPTPERFAEAEAARGRESCATLGSS